MPITSRSSPSPTGERYSARAISPIWWNKPVCAASPGLGAPAAASSVCSLIAVCPRLRLGVGDALGVGLTRADREPVRTAGPAARNARHRVLHPDLIGEQRRGRGHALHVARAGHPAPAARTTRVGLEVVKFVASRED